MNNNASCCMPLLLIKSHLGLAAWTSKAYLEMLCPLAPKPQSWHARCQKSPLCLSWRPSP